MIKDNMFWFCNRLNMPGVIKWTSTSEQLQNNTEDNVNQDTNKLSQFCN